MTSPLEYFLKFQRGNEVKLARSEILSSGLTFGKINRKNDYFTNSPKIIYFDDLSKIYIFYKKISKI